MSALAAGATARELVPGDPDRLDVLVARCRTLADGLSGAAARVRAVDAGDWRGPAGDAFRAVVDAQPRRYADAGEAFAAAGGAVAAFAGVLREEQATARAAVAIAEQARVATAAWARQVADHEEEVARAALAPHPARLLAGLAGPPACDPGAADLARAEAMLAGARERVATAGTLAARRLAHASLPAPAAPGFWHGVGHVVAEVGRGAWETTEGTAVLAWDLSPVRMVADPEGWSSSVDQVALGAAYGARHPVELGKALLDWDTWRTSPGRAVGHLVPDLVLGLLSGGAAEAARGATAATELSAATATFRRAERLRRVEQVGALPRARAALAEGRVVDGRAVQVVGRVETADTLRGLGDRDRRHRSGVVHP